jgi:hypothetical protein
MAGVGGKTTQLWKTNDLKANKDAKDHCTVYWTNKNTYVGDWKNNRKDGRGTFVAKDKKLRYEGEFVEGRREGHGVLWKEEGKGQLRRVYEGAGLGGKRHGAGTLYSSNGDVYTGEFVAGKKEGQGKTVYGNDEYYEGEYVADMRQGYGVLIKANGDRYEGNWAADKKEGPGVYYYVAKSQMYKGEWRDDIPKCGELVDLDDGSQEHDAARVVKFVIPDLEMADADGVLGSRINTLRIERAAAAIRGGAPVSAESFTEAQLMSLRKGFDIVDEVRALLRLLLQLRRLFGALFGRTKENGRPTPGSPSSCNYACNPGSWFGLAHPCVRDLRRPR